MSKKKSKRTYPPGWNARRVKRVIAHYEQLSEDEQVAEDEQAARASKGQAVIAVPEELLPAIRELLAAHGHE
jgi:hypothetical protein